MDTLLERLDEVLRRLEDVEETLDRLVRQSTVKDWYTTAEAAEHLGRAEFTVREWCRLCRIHARKKASRRGLFQEWIIARAELERIERDGLLPVAKN